MAVLYLMMMFRSLRLHQLRGMNILTGVWQQRRYFVPDVLPVNVADDKDNDPDNDSITITKNKMSYGSDSLGTGLGLDEDTTVDTGDYLALYATGNDEIQYAVITNVSTNNADYIITYKNVTWDEVRQPWMYIRLIM